jgi:hypothetical protein
MSSYKDSNLEKIYGLVIASVGLPKAKSTSVYRHYDPSDGSYHGNKMTVEARIQRETSMLLFI